MTEKHLPKWGGASPKRELVSTVANPVVVGELMTEMLDADESAAGVTFEGCACEVELAAQQDGMAVEYTLCAEHCASAFVISLLESSRGLTVALARVAQVFDALSPDDAKGPMAMVLEAAGRAAGIVELSASVLPEPARGRAPKMAEQIRAAIAAVRSILAQKGGA